MATTPKCKAYDCRDDKPHKAGYRVLDRGTAADWCRKAFAADRKGTRPALLLHIYEQ